VTFIERPSPNHAPRPDGTIVDVLVVRWMKSRRLGYEVTEDLGGEPRSE